MGTGIYWGQQMTKDTAAEWQANWMRDGTADHGPVVQAFARHRIAGQSASCDLGVGCDEAGVCYAKANGKPEMCHRTTSLATIAALEQPTPELAYIEPKLSADQLRAALEARGFEIRKKNDD
jgi:hypothetical protein